MIMSHMCSSVDSRNVDNKMWLENVYIFTTFKARSELMEILIEFYIMICLLYTSKVSQPRFSLSGRSLLFCFVDIYSELIHENQILLD